MLPLGILLLVLLGLLYPWRQRSYTLSPARVINLAGSLRMLSQRTMKSWLQQGAGIMPEQAAAQLAESISVFDQRLLLLKAWAKTPASQYLVSRIDHAWVRFRNQMIQPPQRERAQALMRECNDLLYVCDELVEAVVRQNGKREASLINVAGRQRMLLQRIAKNCAAMSWGLCNDRTRHELLDAVDLFEASQQALLNSRFNTTVVNTALQQASQQWTQVRPGCQLHCSGNCKPAGVATMSDSLLQQMDRITAMYQQIMDGGNGDISEEFLKANLPGTGHDTPATASRSQRNIHLQPLP